MVFNKTRAYHFFFLVTLLTAIIGIKSFYEDTTLVINVYDTYYVISDLDVAILLCIMYFLQGLGYWFVQKVMKRNLVSWLTTVHTFILIGSFVYYWIFLAYYEFLENPPGPLFSNFLRSLNVTLTILTLLIICIGLPAYIVNLFIGIFRRRN